MTRRTRKTIFYILVIFFVIAGSAVVLYADGWRIDLATFHTEKVGGIYVRAFPQGASISLDGTPIANTSNFLSHGTLITNLFPKNYELGLSTPGYDAWKENAEVTPSLVLEMKYAVLVPQFAATLTTTTDVMNFFAVGGVHVDAHASGTITWRGATVATGTIVSHSADLKNMVYRDPKGSYLLYDFTTQKTIDLTAALVKQKVLPASIISIMIDPYNDTSALAITAGRIWNINLETQAAAAIGTASSGVAFAPIVAASQNALAWSEFNASSGASMILVYDKFSREITAASPAIPGTTGSLAWINGDTIGAVESDGSLVLYTISSDNIRPLASDVKTFYPTSDGALLAALEPDSLEIFDFADNDYYRFHLPNMESIQGLAWYKDEAHLFVAYPNTISFFDLADTSLINVTTISEGTSPSYDPQTNELYLQNHGSILRFDFPN